MKKKKNIDSYLSIVAVIFLLLSILDFFSNDTFAIILAIITCTRFLIIAIEDSQYDDKEDF